MSPIACNQPDLTVFLKGDVNHILQLEVSCPADVNIVEKEGEKIAKFHKAVIIGAIFVLRDINLGYILGLLDISCILCNCTCFNQ